jgi:L-iditol 2-dehydrogenase
MVSLVIPPDLVCSLPVDSLLTSLGLPRILVAALRSGGVLMEIGNGHNEQMIPLQNLSMREVDVRFLFRYINTWPLVLRMLSAGKLVGVQEMITHTFKLEESVEAFLLAADPKGGSVKVQIVDEDEDEEE